MFKCIFIGFWPVLARKGVYLSLDVQMAFNDLFNQ